MFETLFHAIIRHRTKLRALPTSRYSVRLASSTDERRGAYNLIRATHYQKGVEPPSGLGSGSAETESQVLIAWEAMRMVGAIRVTLDSNTGLPLDSPLPGHLERLRGPGNWLAEIDGVAILPPARGRGLDALLRVAAYRLAWQLGSTHLVIGVHPRLAPVHKATMGFVPRHSARIGPRHRGALLSMTVDRQSQRSHLRRFGGRDQASGRMLHDLVFGEYAIANTELCPEPLDLDLDESERNPWTQSVLEVLSAPARIMSDGVPWPTVSVKPGPWKIKILGSIEGDSQEPGDPEQDAFRLN